MTDWKIGDPCRVWRSGWIGEHEAGGYEYGNIGSLSMSDEDVGFWSFSMVDDSKGDIDVMLVGDDGKEIYAQVKDLEEG